MGLLLVVLLALQAPSSCPDLTACRAEAEAAAARGDFETFHDLAWRAIQKGRPNDPAQMILLARAQALSGRPDDAFVMLGRLADLHATVDVTLHDFDRVRARPGWPELEARLTGRPAAAPEAPPVPRAPLAPGAPPALPPPLSRAASAGASVAPLAVPPAELDFDPPAVFSPFAIAHDAVSRRFVVGDSPSRRLLVIDEVSRHVVPYVSAASAGFFDDLTGLTIDDRRGDLWVVSAKGAGGDSSSVLHKLQLVSGRGLGEVRPEENLPARFVDVAVTPDGTVFVLDATGPRLFRLRPGARSLEMALRFEARGVTALAAVDERVLFVGSEGGLLRVDLGARAAQPVKGVDDLSGFASLAWRNGAVVGVQRVQGASLVVRVALDGSGTRAQPRAILAASPSAIVGTLASGSFFYLVDGHAIRRLAVR